MTERSLARSGRSAPLGNFRKDILAVSAALAFVGVGFSLVVCIYFPSLGLAAVLNSTLFAFLALQCAVEMGDGGPLGLLSPAVLASIFHFFRSYALPFLLLPISPAVLDNLQRWVPGGNAANLLVGALFLANLAAIAFWVGYRLSASKSIGLSIAHALRRGGLVRSTLNINTSVLLASVVISIASFLISIRLGVFGYSSNYNALFVNAEYRQMLTVGQSLLPVALFLLTYGALLRRKHAKIVGWRYPLILLLFLLDVGVGFLSGFKGQVAFPAVVVAGAYFLAVRRFPLIPALLVIPLLWAAYSVIEPFRVEWNLIQGRSPETITKIVGTMARAASSSSASLPISGGVMEAATKEELLSFVGATISALHRDPNILNNAPGFLQSILLSPIYAVIPRAVWPDKPIYQFGYWYAQRVLGDPPDMRNSVAMSPISYFLFIGGDMAVILGFLFLGVIYRIVFEALSRSGSGGWLVYLMIVPTMAVIYSEVGPSLTGLFMGIVSGLIIQRIMLRQ